MLQLKFVINAIQHAEHVKTKQIFVYLVSMHFCSTEIVYPVALMDYMRIIQQWYAVYAKAHV